MEIISKNEIKHIPIIDQQKLLEIVSIGEVVNRIIENYAYETEHLKHIFIRKKFFNLKSELKAVRNVKVFKEFI